MTTTSSTHDSSVLLRHSIRATTQTWRWPGIARRWRDGDGLALLVQLFDRQSPTARLRLVGLLLLRLECVLACTGRRSRRSQQTQLLLLLLLVQSSRRTGTGSGFLCRVTAITTATTINVRLTAVLPVSVTYLLRRRLKTYLFAR